MVEDGAGGWHVGQEEEELFSLKRTIPRWDSTSMMAL